MSFKPVKAYKSKLINEKFDESSAFCFNLSNVNDIYVISKENHEYRVYFGLEDGPLCYSPQLTEILSNCMGWEIA